MNLIRTICPKCFKIFSVSEDCDKVRCDHCAQMYDLPKFSAVERKED